MKFRKISILLAAILILLAVSVCRAKQEDTARFKSLADFN